MSYTLVAGQRLNVGGSTYEPGAVLPSDIQWPHIGVHIQTGTLCLVVDSGDRRGVPQGVDPTGQYVFTSLEACQTAVVQDRWLGGVPEAAPAKAAAPEPQDQHSEPATVEAPAESGEDTPAPVKAPAKRATKATKATKKKA